MTDEQILYWMQSFAYRISKRDGIVYIHWLDADENVYTTEGCNIKDAVIGAKLERDKLYG